MIFRKLPLDGAFIIHAQYNEDSRGFFARTFCEQEFNKAGLNTKWVQMNNSYSKNKGTLRGLHYQINPFSEVKVVRCVKGAIWDVIVDLRKESTSFGNWYGEELTEDNRSMMYVPKGFAHGFITLTDHSEIIYLVSNPYCKDHEAGLLWNDTDIGIKWPLIPVQISSKDKNNLTFSQLRQSGFIS